MNMNKQDRVANGAKRPNAGVDVSKQHLDARWDAHELRVGNDAAGWGELTAKFKASAVDLIVIEATGGGAGHPKPGWAGGGLGAEKTIQRPDPIAIGTPPPQLAESARGWPGEVPKNSRSVAGPPPCRLCARRCRNEQAARVSRPTPPGSEHASGRARRRSRDDPAMRRRCWDG